MTILKVIVDDGQDDELKELLNSISFIKSVEEEHITVAEPNDAYIKIKKLLDEAKGKNLFNDIKDPVKRQREIRKERERDF